MIGRLKQIAGDWLELLVSLVTFPAAALFGFTLCWLLGPCGLDVIPDAACYQLRCEDEQRRGLPVLESKQLAVASFEDPGNQSHTENQTAFLCGCLGVRANDLERSVSVDEQLAKGYLYLSMGIAQGHLLDSSSESATCRAVKPAVITIGNGGRSPRLGEALSYFLLGNERGPTVGMAASCLLWGWSHQRATIQHFQRLPQGGRA